MNATVIPRTTSRKTRRWEGFVTFPCEGLSTIGKSLPFRVLENDINLSTYGKQRMPRLQATASASCWCRTQLHAPDMVVMTRATLLKRSKGRLSLAVDGGAIAAHAFGAGHRHLRAGLHRARSFTV